MIITSEFFSFNVWEWFLHSSILERTESDLSKINWLCGVILLNSIVLVPWGRFPLCHPPIKPISAFRDQISILIVGYVITWSRGSHHNPHVTTPIPRKPSKSGLIGVWHKDNLYLGTSTIGNRNPHPTNIDSWRRSIRMMPRS